MCARARARGGRRILYDYVILEVLSMQFGYELFFVDKLSEVNSLRSHVVAMTKSGLDRRLPFHAPHCLPDRGRDCTFSKVILVPFPHNERIS